MPFPFSDMTRAAPLLRGASRRRFDHTCQQGSAIIYVFVAIGLLAALTYSFVKDSGQSVVAQSAHRTSEDLYIQASTIRAAIVECAVQYPNGGGDMDGDGDIDSTDNPNNPYPVLPTYANNPHGVAADNTVRNLSCTGAPAAEANIFQGTNNKGRFLPPATSGFGEWVYGNDADGVYIRVTATAASAITVNALDRVMARFSACQADLDFGGCGAACLTIWVQRLAACP